MHPVQLGKGQFAFSLAPQRALRIPLHRMNGMLITQARSPHTVDSRTVGLISSSPMGLP